MEFADENVPTCCWLARIEQGERLTKAKATMSGEMKINFNKVAQSEGQAYAPSYDEEAGAQHHTVRVTFAFADGGRRVTRAFSSGETARGLKKQLFDALEVPYGKMTLEHDGEELIGPRASLALRSSLLLLLLFPPPPLLWFTLVYFCPRAAVTARCVETRVAHGARRPALDLRLAQAQGPDRV